MKDDDKLTIALAGNPNSGKTTIFNALTGSRQKVGNWPGVTVEKKVGIFTHQDVEVEVVDLPGIYGLTAYSIDEKIARDFIIEEGPDLVVVIVDATNLERNLYLTTQLLELGVDVVVALNMMDLVLKSGTIIDTETLSNILGVPVIETVATKKHGINSLKELIVKEASSDKKREVFSINYKHDVENAISELSEELDKLDIPDKYPERWLLIKLLEGDIDLQEMIRKHEGGDDFESELINTEREIEQHLGYDVETVIVERRYAFLKGVTNECCKRKLKLNERLNLSDKIDRIITNPILGIPIFLGMMWLTFQLVFTIGNPLAGLLDRGIGLLSVNIAYLLESIGTTPYIISLLTDGVIGGVGSVVVFLPNILLLFLAISILEDSGYMARAAFVVDKVMHAFGLHGKSFIPMIIGFGCNVPAIMACRTLETRKDRILTILIAPLMSCSARLPIYVLFASAFFPHNQGMVVLSLYLLGIILAMVVARIFKGVFFPEETNPLVMELPPYRLPHFSASLAHTWMRGKMFLRKAGTIIFMGSVILWVLAVLPWGVEYATKGSIIGQIGSFVAPIFKTAGFGFWQASVALLSGVMAKEIVVATLGTLYGTSGSGLISALQGYFTPLSAYAFLAFTLIYIPCIAVIGVIWRETNWKWALLTVAYTTTLAWIVSTLIYQIGGLIF